MLRVSFEYQVTSHVVSEVTVGKCLVQLSSCKTMFTKPKSDGQKKGRGSLRVLSLSLLSSIFGFGKTGKAQHDTEE